MKLFLDALRREGEYKGITDTVSKGKSCLVSGVVAGLRPILLEALYRDSGKFTVALFGEEREALALYEQLSAGDIRCSYLPSREAFFGEAEATGHDLESSRLAVFTSLAAGETDILFTTAEALAQYTVSPEGLASSSLVLTPGQEISEDEVVRRLSSMGYVRCDMVDGKGQFSRRGDLIDFYSPHLDYPVRVEFFGDEIDTISAFDIITQRRVDTLRKISLTPSVELYADAEAKARIIALLNKAIKSDDIEISRAAAVEKERVEQGSGASSELYVSLLFPETATALSHIPEDALFCMFDTDRISARLEGAFDLISENIQSLLKSRPELSRMKLSVPMDDPDLFFEKLAKKTYVAVDSLRSRVGMRFSEIFDLASRKSISLAQNPDMFFEDIRSYRNDGATVVIMSQNSVASDSLMSLLTSREIPALLNPSPENIIGNPVIVLCAMQGQTKRYHMTEGFELQKSRFVLLFDNAPLATEARSRRHRTRYKSDSKERIMSYNDLAVGDYVVHINHGIGVYGGIKSITTDGVQKDYLVLNYAQGDVLYVPCNSLDSVSKYIGAGEGGNVKINRLSSADWQRTKSRAKAAAKDIAKELIRLYSARRSSKGHAFSTDTPWQAEFEGAFGYEETDGQLDAVEDIKRDMESEVPMDRLLCGDVGFGKTEVALRGVFKCVMDNMQAAILAPTTVLAWQHYNTIVSRFRGFPVKVAMLSRFSSRKEIKEALEGIENGSVDIVVGTHRLLQKDVKFKRLGFLVVDEEQRFGVTHKEKLKELSVGVDVLTLTATPIPRTLNMALSGIRDMSILEEAPGDRFPVQTYVMEYDDSTVFEAIRREVRRGGQVFYLLNNTEALEGRAKRIMDAVDGVTVATAHGKMDREELSEIWRDMYDGKIDVLVCTTIIETGVDVPNANTLIIENADRYGLSQLHQIRGRVGRSNRRAFAYLTYKKGREVSELAEKRLSAIREYTEFGSGFKIAMRDLEIRGAGNILGAEQHGHMDSVGYDLYIRLLDDAMREERGEEPTSQTEELPSVDLTIDAFIPSGYISSEKQRIDVYKKISQVRDEDSEWELVDELCDRYGEPPRAVMNLVAVARLRPLLAECRIKKITQTEDRVYIYTSPLDKKAGEALGMLWRGRLTFTSATSPYFIFRPEKKKILEELNTLVGEYKIILEKLSQQ
ncbi:MAG: transcription-repair coupling factor [Clostridia bacterium]|nr:transcription-repair coupling factor [Clostridia bacterium]